jgi:hypothetical protein
MRRRINGLALTDDRVLVGLKVGRWLRQDRNLWFVGVLDLGSVKLKVGCRGLVPRAPCCAVLCCAAARWGAGRVGTRASLAEALAALWIVADDG